MPSHQHRGPFDGFGTGERAALRAVAFLFRQSKDFRSSDHARQERILGDLGLSPEQIAYVLAVLRGRRGKVLEPDLNQPVAPLACPIDWTPTVLTPVFWGREQVLAGSAQIPTTIYYPSLDGSPDGAVILGDCGKYPLILFLHGHCASEDEHRVKWERHLAQLARSGFVVAAPFLSGIALGPTQDTLLDDVVAVNLWMRGVWSGKSHLFSASFSGVFGHSYGAMLACRFATTQTVTAYAGLSAGWHEWNTFGSGLNVPLFELSIPSLHVWGTEGLFSDAIVDADWAKIGKPKHRVVLHGGEHWTYLQGTSGGCAPPAGGCPHLGNVAGDLLTGFFARYLPPQEQDVAGASIPKSLVPPSVPLTFEQEFYAGGHLMGLKMLPFSEGCTITSHWDAISDSGTVTLSSP